MFATMVSSIALIALFAIFIHLSFFVYLLFREVTMFSLNITYHHIPVYFQGGLRGSVSLILAQTVLTLQSSECYLLHYFLFMN
jgi:hypothetical protein